MNFEIKLQKAFKKIKEANNVLLICHERPDGDSISSVCALAELMEILNKKYLPFCVDAPENIFSYLPHFEKIAIGRDNLDFAAFDLIIILDCGQLARAGIAKEVESRRPNQFVIEFDHHPKIHDYADLSIKIPEAASTTEILYQFFKNNKIKMNKKMANCILTGISTDTGNFLYPSTSNQTITIASEMLTRGAQLPQIVQNTWYNKSLDSMKLWGLAMSKLVINKKYNLAFSVLTLDEIKEFQADDDVFTAMVGFMSNLPDVKGVMLLREEEGGKLKGSLRSAHPTADLSKLAFALGGGGHPKTSGFIMEGKLEVIEGRYQIIQ